MIVPAAAVSGGMLIVGIDMRRTVRSIKNITDDIGSAAINLYGAAVERDSNKLWDSGKDVAKIPLHALDAVVYSIGFVLPIGWVWEKIRGQ